MRTMTSAAPETYASPWPVDPASASIADWIEDQRSLLPMFAIICAAVGALLVGGLLNTSNPQQFRVVTR